MLPLAAFVALSTAIPARAGIIVTAESVNASDGAFDVFLTNTGPSAVDIASFSFEVNVNSPQVTFTDATYNTTTNSYIFAGNSLFGPDILTGISNGGQTLDAGDTTADASNVSVASGASVGLGHVLFSISGTLGSAATVSFTGFPETSLGDASGADVPIAGFVNGTISPTVGTVPEPAALVLASTGLAFFGAAWMARRPRRK